MRVIGKSISIPPRSQSQPQRMGEMYVTAGKEYEVHALCVFEGEVAVQVIDDRGEQSWKESWLFDMIDASLPSDWICKMFQQQPTMILGPEFVARDIESYGEMVEGLASQEERFWQRIRAQRYEPVKQILIKDWDPIGIKDEPAGHDLYDPYIPNLLKLLDHQPSEQQIFDYLWRTVNDDLRQVGDRTKTSLVTQKILSSI